jgi:uncharacterized protein YjbI with pentapeptide repeats
MTPPIGPETEDWRPPPSTAPSSGGRSADQGIRRFWRHPAVWAVPLAAVALVLILWIIPAVLTRSPPLAGAEKHKALADVRTVLVYAAVAIAGLGALSYTARTFRMEKVGRLTQRFQAASTQLGNEHAAVRVAAVQALALLADEWPEQRQSCVNVICAFLRAVDDEKKPVASRYERRAGFDLLRMRLAEDPSVATQFGPWFGRARPKGLRPSPASWRGCDLDLSGMVVEDGSLHGAILSSGRVSFEGAQFIGGVDFSEIEFCGAAVSFHRATFTAKAQVSFEHCTFRAGRVSFRKAAFTGGDVRFDSATFDVDGAVCFAEAELGFGGTVTFDHASLAGADDERPDHGGVSFAYARFGNDTGVNNAVSFKDATFLGTVSFERAQFRRTVSFQNAVLTGATLRLAPVQLEPDVTLSFTDAKTTDMVLDLTGTIPWLGRIDMSRLGEGRPHIEGNPGIVDLGPGSERPSEAIDGA